MACRLVFVFFAAIAALTAGDWLQLSPANPHYFAYRGKTIVLVTSGEHYGAVVNRAFDYRRYLAEIERKHLNHTRIWTGPYREVEGSFSIANNTLAPRPEDFVTPWPRSQTSGALDGGNKFDLASWNPAFFVRLKDFLREARARRIVVEVNLFCPYYRDDMWKVAPLNVENNVNGVGRVARKDALTLAEPALVEVQDAFVRKMAAELGEFGNLFFEICNEPYAGSVPAEWQRHIAKTLHDAEQDGKRHLIAMNIANGSVRVTDPDPLVSIFNFHYSRPPRSVEMNYDLARAIGMNETGFDGDSDSAYRIQGWDFLMAGGALYNNLDYSFTVGHEDGSFAYLPATPGGGSARLRTQLGILRDWFDRLDLDHMRPDTAVLKGGSGRALSDGRSRYVAYFHQGRVDGKAKPRYTVDGGEHRESVRLALTPGRYEVVWVDPKSGRTLGHTRITVEGDATLESPLYTEDLVLDIHGL
jgi:hypothetical protein